VQLEPPELTNNAREKPLEDYLRSLVWSNISNDQYNEYKLQSKQYMAERH
jgi:hypothetical protein